MKRIVTIGEILVEIMATEPGEGFLEPLALRRPVPVGRAGDLHRSGRRGSASPAA